MQTKLNLYLGSRNMFLDLVTWKQVMWSRVLPAWLLNHHHGAVHVQDKRLTKKMETFKETVGKISFDCAASQAME